MEREEMKRTSVRAPRKSKSGSFIPLEDLPASEKKPAKKYTKKTVPLPIRFASDTPVEVKINGVTYSGTVQEVIEFLDGSRGRP
jgi:hypothetical protein